jgi:hypothetical protein
VTSVDSEVDDERPHVDWGAYTRSDIRWDCTSADPRLRWTTDNERHCYRDWQTVVQAIAALPDVIVTDPLTVGIAFGRPPTYRPA